LTVISTWIRQALANGRKANSSSILKRRTRKLPVSTRQWLILTFGLAVVVGAIFITALLYLQSGK